MESVVKAQSVLVACPRGEAHKRLVRLRRYEWSVSEAVFMRVDGEDDKYQIRKAADGLQAYPHPEFKCPVAGCDRHAVYEHDNFQDMLRRAADSDGVIFI